MPPPRHFRRPTRACRALVARTSDQPDEALWDLQRSWNLVVDARDDRALRLRAHLDDQFKAFS